MLGVDPKVMMHMLGIHSGSRPIKQKKQNFAPERAKAIKAEIEKLIEMQYVREVDYPEWLANVVLVPKGEGK